MTSSVPNIFVHEFVTGGGWPEADLPAGLAAEGLAMLRAVLTDFQAWGAVKITTTLDHRLSQVSLPAEQVIRLDPQEHARVLEQMAEQCTAALIIAPETNGILARISALMARRGARLLGCSPESIDTAGNKWALYKRLTQAGLPTPETRLVYLQHTVETAEKMGFPLVIKPVDGVGCEGVNLIPDPRALQTVLETDDVYGNRVLLQPYIEGDHASVSLLASGHDFSCLSLNRQSIKTGMPFSYQGGEVLSSCPEQEDAFDLAKRAAALVPGLKGYVGVDMLVTREGACIIEINPRLTTAYVGLRRVVNINLAEAIWEAAIGGVLPRNTSLSGNTVF